MDIVVSAIFSNANNSRYVHGQIIQEMLMLHGYNRQCLL